MMAGPLYANWELLATTETGMTLYIDRETIQRDVYEVYLVTMSVLHDYAMPERLLSGLFLSFTAQEQYDFGTVRSRTVTAVVFTEHMGNGAVLFSGTGDNTWQPITPLSINHALGQEACPDGKSTKLARTE
ncbi:MAG TPA: surface-adhesin E family protein [Nitrospira sp.]|nr:surface-adhesin E family protein [Nitrospira sp.]